MQGSTLSFIRGPVNIPVYRLEVGLKPRIPDARGRAVCERARTFLGLSIRSCRTRDVYKIAAELSAELREAVKAAFTDPVTSVSEFGRLAPPQFDWLIEIGYKPGVTDNLGRTARAVVEDVARRRLAEGEGVYTATQYFIRGDLSRGDVERLARGMLANTLIHEIAIYDAAEWQACPPDTTVPYFRENPGPLVWSYDLEVSDTELMRISREGILALSLEEMYAIRDYYRRGDVRRFRQDLGLPAGPTDVELECVAQTWSEHCKHKIFSARIRYRDETTGEEMEINSLFDTYIRRATEEISRRRPWLVSVFTDNAGVIRFNQRLNLVCKVETHNTPSALDPYGGALTGIVGVNRDPMGTGLGAEMLCNTWWYCFASPFYRGEVPQGLFHPRRIRDGVHQGVVDGGNQSGIPYARGGELFDERYLGKPLVYCGTIGIMPPEIAGRPSHRKEIRPGDLVVMVGGRIGKDGIHGATFSSEHLHEESPSQAVQIGDPITQRKMYEFLMEARDRGLYRAITDNGAGGLSCSVGEMSTLSGGAEIDLARAPLKYPGLKPWEIFLSEAQERMTVAVPPEHRDAFLELAQRRDVEVSILGEFTDTGLLLVHYRGKPVGALHLDFLYRGCPRMELEARWSPPQISAPRRRRRGKRGPELHRLLSSLNICSKEKKCRMYDHEVKGRTVIKPFVGVNAEVPSDATVLLAEYGSYEGIAVAEGINPYYSDIDTYHMAASVIDIAVRRLVGTGASLDHIAGLDNFCWPDPVYSEQTPDGHFKLAQLVRANQALYDVTVAYGVPCISGKDSMKNDSVRGGRKISIPPTLLFTAVGRVADVRRAVTMYFKEPGDCVFVIGVTRDELGASEYYRMLAARRGDNRIGGRVPRVDTGSALQIYRAMEEAHRAGILKSVHTPALGGLAVGLALAAIGGDVGAEIDLAAVPREEGIGEDALLFSESNSRYIVTCAEQDRSQLERIFHGLPAAYVGRVTGGEDGGPRLQIRGLDGRPLVDEAVRALRRSFRRTLEKI